MRWWEQQVGGATRGRIIALIRRGIATVDEIAAELHVTDNAVRAHLQTLQAAGLVESAGTRQGTGAGKPATLYHIPSSAEAELSAAYGPVLVSLLETLAERLTPRVLSGILRDTGRRLGQSAKSGNASLESRVRAAAEQLSALGAELDVVKTPDGFQLRGYACPLSAAVRSQPHACHVVEQLVSSIVEAPVRECCDRTDGARCRFDILAKSA